MKQVPVVLSAAIVGFVPESELRKALHAALLAAAEQVVAGSPLSFTVKAQYEGELAGTLSVTVFNP